ncbi:GMC family oxidoreductase [Actinoplanes sp. NPDC051343]|uniref:GMC family oxidoreductase n=1 Tax=Actinoplanes sp. NPDC051343 TaxID=3363906 RepID=UPI0037A73811
MSGAGKNAYDVVVVGDDTAAYVVASRLSERIDLKVLLIKPRAAQPEHLASVVPFMRGHHSSYEAWNAAGAGEWSFYDLLPYFKRSEHVTGRSLTLRGRGGPIHVASPGFGSRATALLAAAVEIGERAAGDIGAGLEEGFGPVDVSMADGRPQPVSDAYLAPVAGRTNLTVVSGALLHRLNIAKDTVTGVDFSVGTQLTQVSAQEVVITAGAVASAHLLMLSGIGPAIHLRRHGIDVVADLAGVGTNLHGHLVSEIIYRSAATFDEPGGVIGLARSDPDMPGPDLQLRFGDLWRPRDGGSFAGRLRRCGVAIAVPHSRGSVRLASPMPSTAPLVDPASYDERDLAAVTVGIRMARRIAGSDALAGIYGAEVIPGPAIGEERELRDYARRAVTVPTYPVGTLAMGEGPSGVVDRHLRVHSLRGVRVADGSIIPAIPSADPTATVCAIAERTAELILHG